MGKIVWLGFNHSSWSLHTTNSPLNFDFSSLLSTAFIDFSILLSSVMPTRTQQQFAQVLPIRLHKHPDSVKADPVAAYLEASLLRYKCVSCFQFPLIRQVAPSSPMLLLSASPHPYRGRESVAGSSWPWSARLPPWSTTPLNLP